jgi:indolepyruvate ferredoxin oxidoreductase
MTGELTAAVARNLFKVMAYKDEYEVARLQLSKQVDEEIAAEFDQPVGVRYQLHPPFLRRLGRTQKISFGPWFRNVFRVLVAVRGLRGTSLDPFGWQASRREEREIVNWYRELLDKVLDGDLSSVTFPIAVEIAELPDSVRGYENVKTANLARARRRANKLEERYSHGEATPLPTVSIPLTQARRNAR